MFEKLIKDATYEAYIGEGLKLKPFYAEYHKPIEVAIEHICAIYTPEELESIRLFEHKDDKGFSASQKLNKDGSLNYIGCITYVNLFIIYKLKNEDPEGRANFIKICNSFHATEHKNFVYIGRE